MTEQFPMQPDVADNEPTEPKLDAKRCVFEYSSYGPDPIMGDLPLTQLQQWQDVMERERLSPDQMYQLGWIYMEHAFGIMQQNDGAPDDEQKEAIRRKFAQADQTFQDILDKPGVNRALKVQTLLSMCGLPILEGLVVDDERQVLDKYPDFFSGQMAAAKEQVKLYEKFKNLSDVPALHSLAVFLLVSQNLTGNNNIYAFPAPPRAQVSDAKDTWTMLMIDPVDAKLWKGRVAAGGAKGMLTIPPEFLRNDQYPSRHGHGTLQALLDDDAKARVPRFYSGGRPIKTAADEHIRRASADLDEHLASQMEAVVSELVEKGETPENPAQIYLDISAHQHPSKIHGESLETLISLYEVPYLGGELSLEESMILGWMHMESGYKGLIDGDVSDSPFGAFDHAEDIFGEIATAYMGQEKMGQGYEALISKATAKAYKLIGQASHEGFDQEEARQEYIAELVSLAEEILEEYAGLEDYNSQAAYDLKYTLQMLSALLVASVGTYDGHIAALSTLRQKGVTERNGNGWDITIWRQTPEGFKPDYYGKARIADREQPSSLDYGVVTIPEAVIIDDMFSVLRYAIDMVDNSADPALGKGFERAVKKLTSAADIAEW